MLIADVPVVTLPHDGPLLTETEVPLPFTFHKLEGSWTRQFGMYIERSQASNAQSERLHSKLTAHWEHMPRRHLNMHCESATQPSSFSDVNRRTARTCKLAAIAMRAVTVDTHAQASQLT